MNEYYSIKLTYCEGRYAAHLIEYDMIGHGDTPENALKNLIEVWECAMKKSNMSCKFLMAE